MVNDLGDTVTCKLLPEMVQEVFLETRWFNVLTKLKKQEVEQDVHISWERGSIYFDPVKIYPGAPYRKGKQGQAGLALSRMVKYY